MCSGPEAWISEPALLETFGEWCFVSGPWVPTSVLYVTAQEWGDHQDWKLLSAVLCDSLCGSGALILFPLEGSLPGVGNEGVRIIRADHTTDGTQCWWVSQEALLCLAWSPGDNVEETACCGV